MFLKIKIWEIINVAFLNLKKVVKDRALPIQPQKLVKEKKNPPPPPKKNAKNWPKVYIMHFSLYYVEDLVTHTRDQVTEPGADSE